MKKAFLLLFSLVIISACDGVDMENISSRLDSLEQASLASIQNQINQINETIGTLQGTQAQLTGYVNELQTSVGTLDGNYSSLSERVGGLEEKNAKFEEDIATLKKAIEEDSKNIKQWVEESYATLQQFNSLQELVSGIQADVLSIQTQLSTLDERTQKIADDLQEATESLTGELNKCKTDIEEIKNSLKALQDDMDSVKEQIAAIVSSVQSVVVVPDYAYGAVRMTSKSDNKLRFEVYPLEAASNLVALGPSAFSLDCVEIETKSDLFTNIPITSVSFDGEVVEVIADGTNLPDYVTSSIWGDSDASARLRISDAVYTRSTEYFPLVYELFELLPVTNITEVSATLSAYVPKMPADDESVRFYVTCSSSWYTWNSDDVVLSGNILSYTFNRLHSGSSFHYKFVASKRGSRIEENRSAEGEFTTLSIDATVTAGEAFGITSRSAILTGSLVINKQYDYDFEVGGGFVYSKSKEAVERIKKESEPWFWLKIKDGSFQEKIGDLEPNTEYYYIACASINGQMVYSTIHSFKTPDGIFVNIDGSFSDWDNLPSEKYSEAICAEGNPWNAITKIRVASDDQYIYGLLEFNKDRFDEIMERKRLEGVEEIVMDLCFNSDGDINTGGWAELFTDACVDNSIEFSYNGWEATWADVSEWIGEPNGNGWNWNWDSYEIYIGKTIEVAGDKNRMEFRMRKSKYDIGFQICDSFSFAAVLYDESWDFAGVLPNVTPTDSNPNGLASTLWVETL